jgi:hypothetical protein
MIQAKADAVIISFSDFITHSNAQLEGERGKQYFSTAARKEKAS